MLLATKTAVLSGLAHSAASVCYRCKQNARTHLLLKTSRQSAPDASSCSREGQALLVGGAATLCCPAAPQNCSTYTRRQHSRQDATAVRMRLLTRHRRKRSWWPRTSCRSTSSSSSWPSSASRDGDAIAGGGVCDESQAHGSKQNFHTVELLLELERYALLECRQRTGNAIITGVHCACALWARFPGRGVGP